MFNTVEMQFYCLGWLQSLGYKPWQYNCNFSTYLNKQLFFTAEAVANVKFQELLIIGKFDASNKTPTPIGSMCLNVQSALSDKTKLVVYLRTQLSLDERQGGSKSTSWLDAELHTIEEKRTEHFEQCDPESCRKPSYIQSLYIAVQKDKLFVHHKQSSCSKEEDGNKEYPLETSRELVGEGASFALMRLLALVKYIGQFELESLYINGDICRNIYQCTGPESGLVNEKRMDVCTIYRRIIEQCGIEHISKTVLTVLGRIVTHEWEGCDYCVYINPLLDISPLPTVNPVENVDWSNDLQLFSMYLDKKQLCSTKFRTYMRDRPDIYSVLSDYVQSILEVKPPDVVKFTMEYFTRYS